MTLAFTGVADPFVMQLKVAGVTGMLLASPVWLYQLWRFVTPGLHRNERRWALGFAARRHPDVPGRGRPGLQRPAAGPGDPARVHPGEHREHHLGRPLPVVLPADDAGVRARLHAAAAGGRAEPRRRPVRASGCGRGGGGSCWGSWCSPPMATPTGDPFNLALLAVPMLLLMLLAGLVCWLNDRRRSRRRSAEPAVGRRRDIAVGADDPGTLQ